MKFKPDRSVEPAQEFILSALFGMFILPWLFIAGLMTIATIIEYFTNALKDAARCKPDGKNYKYWQFFRVGYPGNRRDLPFNLNDLRVDMTVTDMEVTPEEFPHDSYMHLKLHFKVTMDWKPDLDNYLWKDMDVRYKHRDIYEFDDTLTLMRLPLGAEGEAAG